MPGASIQGLKILLANTYTLYLKTQNYHWNVAGPNFIMLHQFFEKQYESLADAVDVIAERIKALGADSPGSFQEFISLKTLDEAKANLNASAMINDLLEDHKKIGKNITLLLEQARNENDEVTENLLIDRLEEHEKSAWMLDSHLK